MAGPTIMLSPKAIDSVLILSPPCRPRPVLPGEVGDKTTMTEWGCRQALDRKSPRVYTTGIYNEGATVKTTLFQSNRTQAVRLPKDVAFPDGVKSVTVLREGNRRVIVPSDAVWEDFFASPGVDLGVRDQPAPQTREAF